MEDTIERVVEDTKEILEEILLSGFQNVHLETLQALERLQQTYEQYGLYKGKALLEKLTIQLQERKNNRQYDVQPLVASYSQLEFYIACL